MTTRLGDARALVRWARRQGADVRRGRRGLVVSVDGRHVAVVHETPGHNGLRRARADIERALRRRDRAPVQTGRLQGPGAVSLDAPAR